jgi:hypothetical protein
MAKVLKTFDFVGSRSNRYDWAAWSDGSIWQLTKGEDFDCKPQTVGTQARGYAKKNGLSVRISQKDDSVVLQFIKKPQQDGEAKKPAKK